MAREEVCYRDRTTDKLKSELLILPRLQALAGTFRAVLFLYDLLLNTRFFCWLVGLWQDRSASRQNIQAFVKKYDIDTDEIERPLHQYTDFNDFFSRRLKPGARPFDGDLNAFCSPADGKVMVYPQLDDRTRLPVKGAHVDIISLLASETQAHPYQGGGALVVRLAPYDYHRFHFPADGLAGETRSIPGRYYRVNPLSLSLKPDLFAHNKRALTYVDTEAFGCIAYIEVAGFAVGRLVQTYEPGPVRRGQEKGYFQFGGSTLVLLFEPDLILFDDDLVRDTEADLEVQVRVGMRLGRRR